MCVSTISYLLTIFLLFTIPISDIQVDDVFDNIFAMIGFLFELLEIGNGGDDFMDSLTWHVLNVSETGSVFNYLNLANILSYVVQKRSGMTPEEYAKTNIFPKLGISKWDYEWPTNRDGMSLGMHGLLATPRAMAKHGMLYLQNGHSSADDAVFDEGFVAQATQGTKVNPGFGYGWRNREGNTEPTAPSGYSSEGLAGAFIAVDHSLGRVIALTGNSYELYFPIGEDWANSQKEQLYALFRDPNCSFMD